MTELWAVGKQKGEAQNENSEYFNRFKDGVIYKVLGRLQYSTFGELAFLYVKEVLEGQEICRKRERITGRYPGEDTSGDKASLSKSQAAIYCRVFPGRIIFPLGTI